jgi:hypothetical protein
MEIKRSSDPSHGFGSSASVGFCAKTTAGAKRSQSRWVRCGYSYNLLSYVNTNLQTPELPRGHTRCRLSVACLHSVLNGWKFRLLSSFAYEAGVEPSPLILAYCTIPG